MDGISIDCGDDDDRSPSFACSKHQFGRYRLLGRVVRLRKDRRFDVCIGHLDATHYCVTAQGRS